MPQRANATLAVNALLKDQQMQLNAHGQSFKRKPVITAFNWNLLKTYFIIFNLQCLENDIILQKSLLMQPHAVKHFLVCLPPISNLSS